ncbi:unnamed protein product [Pedinophyceae sp. YPF-701]|nr:unnamed protein product [Pedinophyceae sp. YPF-701]
MGAQLGGTDASTVVNSILGAYGLPGIKSAKGLKAFDDFEEEYTFSYPRAWVARPNTLRGGITMSNFQTGDRASVEVVEGVPRDASDDVLIARAVRALITPDGSNKTSNLVPPAPEKIKSETLDLDGTHYVYMAFPSELVTSSGYNVRRKNLAVAAVKRGRLYVLGVAIRSDQFDKDKAAMCQAMMESFRLR